MASFQEVSVAEMADVEGGVAWLVVLGVAMIVAGGSMTAYGAYGLATGTLRGLNQG